MSLATNSPQGFQLWGTIAGRTETGQLSTYQVIPTVNYAPANAAFTGIYKGDFVRLGTAVDTNPGPGYLYPANPGDIGVGVFQGCHYRNIDNWPVYSPYLLNNTQTYVVNGQPTPIYCLVVDDPDALFSVKTSFSGAAVVSSTVPLGVSQAQIGSNANLGIGGTFTDVVPGITPYTSNPANGNARRSHLSAEYLDVASINGTAGSTFKIKQFTPGVDNNPAYTAGVGYGTGMQGAFNNVLVSINRSIFKDWASESDSYFNVTTVIPVANFNAMVDTAATAIPVDAAAGDPGEIRIPLSVVLTISIPSTTAGGTAFTNATPLEGLLLQYLNPTGPALEGRATLVTPVTAVTSIIPTATAGASGSIYIPLINQALTNTFLTANAGFRLVLTNSGATPFAGGANAVITAYVSYLQLAV